MMRIKPEPMLKPREIVLFPGEEPEEGSERPKVKLLHEIRRYRLA
ncbi:MULTISPECIES: hypothetical protein [Thermococcus]|nr:MULTISPECIES: hypothetical protein [Thermococcus]CAI1492416.1 conserved protein of unknown function [Thermococcus nautili]